MICSPSETQYDVGHWRLGMLRTVVTHTIWLVPGMVFSGDFAGFAMNDGSSPPIFVMLIQGTCIANPGHHHGIYRHLREYVFCFFPRHQPNGGGWRCMGLALYKFRSSDIILNEGLLHTRQKLKNVRHEFYTCLIIFTPSFLYKWRLIIVFLSIFPTPKKAVPHKKRPNSKQFFIISHHDFSWLTFIYI